MAIFNSDAAKKIVSELQHRLIENDHALVVFVGQFLRDSGHHLTPGEVYAVVVYMPRGDIRIHGPTAGISEAVTLVRGNDCSLYATRTVLCSVTQDLTLEVVADYDKGAPGSGRVYTNVEAVTEIRRQVDTGPEEGSARAEEALQEDLRYVRDRLAQISRVLSNPENRPLWLIEAALAEINKLAEGEV